MPNPSFTRIMAKVTRAEQHIQDFQLGLSAFLDSNPCTVSYDQDAETGHGIYYVSEIKPVPLTLETIAADVVSNLRAALDNLAYQLVLSANLGTKPKNKVYFPISRTATDYKGTRGGCIKGVGQDIVDAIDATEPYEGGGGHVLWQIQQLSNRDKHELLLETAVDAATDLAPMFRRFFGIAGPLPSWVQINIPEQLLLGPPSRSDPLKIGHVLLREHPSSPEMAKQQKFAFNVTIHKPGVIKAEPAIKTLKDMTNLVGSTLRAFERFFP
jgi:hypothetical protein